MQFPQYVNSPERTVCVSGFFERKGKNGVFIDGKGYIDEDGQIWIFSQGGKPRNKDAYPYFWLNEDGSREFSNPPKLIRKIFMEENLKDLSIATIIDTTVPGEQLLDEDAILDINASTSIFKPILNDDDDFLKKIVKNAIIEKGIDTSRLKSKTKEKYFILNMIAALRNKTKMSTNYFNTWVELLGLDFEITIKNRKGETVDLLSFPLVYDSTKDKVLGLDEKSNKKFDLATGDPVK